jgi:hypothetical protein
MTSEVASKMEVKSKEVIKRLGHNAIYVNAQALGLFTDSRYTPLDSIYLADIYEVLKQLSQKNALI